MKRDRMVHVWISPEQEERWGTAAKHGTDGNLSELVRRAVDAYVADMDLPDPVEAMEAEIRDLERLVAMKRRQAELHARDAA